MESNDILRLIKNECGKMHERDFRDEILRSGALKRYSFILLFWKRVGNE